jgi:hypothetical protein
MRSMLKGEILRSDRALLSECGIIETGQLTTLLCFVSFCCSAEKGAATISCNYIHRDRREGGKRTELELPNSRFYLRASCSVGLDAAHM